MGMSPHTTEVEQALRSIFPHARIAVKSLPRSGSASSLMVDVRLSGKATTFEIEVLKVASRAALHEAASIAQVREDRESDRIRLLASTHFSNESQEFLREAETYFFDLSGNAWIDLPGLYVDRRGFANARPERREERDIYSDKASVVLRILLEASERLGVRQIAQMSAEAGEDVKLSPGYVSKVVTELERRSYLSRGSDGVSLRHAEELLQEWAISYKNRAKPTSISYYVSEPRINGLMARAADIFSRSQIDYVFTAQAGASQVDRFAEFDVVDVYVPDEAAAARALSAAGARPVDRGGNLSVSIPYYKASAFFGAQTPQDSVKVASDVQLYLDLYNYPVRGREQAEHLLERRIKPIIERIGGIS